MSLNRKGFTLIELPVVRKRGFTLIELLVVIAIIGILAAVIVVAVSSARTKARDTKRKADMRTMQSALDSYYYKNSSYPIGFFFSPWCKANATPSWSCRGETNLLQKYPPLTYTGIGSIDPMALYSALITNNYLASLPADPTNTETTGGTTKPYLGDGPPTTGSAPYDLGYVYLSSNGNGYILGTNLEQPPSGSVNSACGNYQMTGGDPQFCILN